MLLELHPGMSAKAATLETGKPGAKPFQPVETAAPRRLPEEKSSCCESATLLQKDDMSPTLAVIVAAGNGTRLRQGIRAAPPKPLFRLCGMRLIERVIVTLRSRGIRRFRIVVGYRASEVVAALKKSRVLRRHDVEIEYILCPDFRKGNGRSLASGTGDLDEPFLLAMSDHVYDPRQVDALLGAAAAEPHRALLVTEPDPERTFDLEDATKLRVDEAGNIVSIGKDIRRFTQVDTGLFYFPTGASPLIKEEIDSGGNGISDVARRYIGLSMFKAVPVKRARWQDVDNLAMARHAEAMLLRGLSKPTDGFVSRHLNRRISIPLSTLLVKLGVTPNMVTTAVLATGVVAAALLFFPPLVWLAALLFQLASVVDGTDGEVARLTWTGSKKGAMYDSVSDAFRYMLFYAALGASLGLRTGSILYLAGAVVFLVLCLSSVICMIRHLGRNAETIVFSSMARELRDLPEHEQPLWQKWTLRLLPLFKLDFLALLTMVLLLADMAPVVFGISLFIAVSMSANVLYHLKKQRAAAPRPPFAWRRLPDWGKTLSTIVGLLLFGLVLGIMPWDGVTRALARGGWQVALVFLVPLGWFAANTAGLHTLLGETVPFRILLYNRLVGEALNASLPMANLGGEPFKVAHLSRYAGFEKSLTAAAGDKLINVGSGLVFSGALLVACFPAARDLPDPVRSLMLPAGALSLIAGLGLVLALAWAPIRSLMIRIVKRIRRNPDEVPRLETGALLRAFAWHLAGRMLLVIELGGFLWILGREAPDGWTLLILAGFLGAIGQVFFMIPQGLGVNEMGITAVLVMLGHGEPLAMAVALLRRGRMVLWAGAGLALLALARGLSLARRAAGLPAAAARRS
jgi:choline kinase/phosphatidylglycerophosphate synthase